MKFNPFCMCCAVGKQEQNIRSFQDMDKKVEYMKKVMDRMANIAEEDCAPSVSVELKKMFRDFWEQPVEDYTSVKKEFGRRPAHTGAEGFRQDFTETGRDQKSGIYAGYGSFS